MSTDDRTPEGWWKRRAVKRYRELQTLRAATEAALEKHADCWPDDPCSELAHDIRAALSQKAQR